jgi:hypothetical protein
MNYNTEHFSPGRLSELRSELEMTIGLQDDTLELLIDILLAANDKTQVAHHNVFLNMFAKIRLNLGAAKAIMPLLYGDYRFKISANLLYRSVIDDLTNMYYLMSFVILPDENQLSLKNELDILHKDYVKGCEAILNSEAGFKNYLQGIFPDTENGTFDADVAIKELRDANPEIFDSVKDGYKTATEIRATSHPVFAGKYPIGNGFITETKKIKFLEAGGFQRHDVLHYLFKYFSQFHHFSPQMHVTMLADNPYDIMCYRVTLMELACAMTIFLRILEVEHQQLLSDRAHALIEHIVTKESSTN